MSAAPMTPNMPATQARAGTPVMIAAEASTIAICNAPLANSKCSSFLFQSSRASSADLARS